ncbi:MAG TPA: hypothetical protein VFA86_08460 [Gammaproteobacteria bacterium]|nr:hypothetical protein [Gammaproteobacteria bacterium]
MADLNQVCADVTNNVANSLGCAVVDLETGLLLGVHHNVPYFTESYLDAVAAAAVDMFRGRTVANVEELLGKQRGEEVRNSIKEVQMSTDGTYHFMKVLPNKPNALAVLITSRKANLGTGWTSLRSAMDTMEPLVP